MLNPASKHNGNAYVMFRNLKSNMSLLIRIWQWALNGTVAFNNLSFKKAGGEGGGITLGYGVVSPEFSVKVKRNKASSPELHLGLLVQPPYVLIPSLVVAREPAARWGWWIGTSSSCTYCSSLLIGAQSFHTILIPSPTDLLFGDLVFILQNKRCRPK